MFQTVKDWKKIFPFGNSATSETAHILVVGTSEYWGDLYSYNTELVPGAWHLLVFALTEQRLLNRTFRARGGRASRPGGGVPASVSSFPLSRRDRDQTGIKRLSAGEEWEKEVQEEEDYELEAVAQTHQETG